MKFKLNGKTLDTNKANLITTDIQKLSSCCFFKAGEIITYLYYDTHDHFYFKLIEKEDKHGDISISAYEISADAAVLLYPKLNATDIMESNNVTEMTKKKNSNDKESTPFAEIINGTHPSKKLNGRFA
jgi:hypothetical protein